MAIALRSARSIASVNRFVTSLTITKPTDVVDGDVMVWMFSGETPAVPTTPAGWVLLHAGVSDSGNHVTQYLYWRVASGEPANYTINLSTNGACASIIYALSGADTTQPTSAQNAQQGNAGTPIVVPATGSWSSRNGIDLLFASVNAQTGSFGIPAGYADAAGSVSTSVHAADGQWKAYTAVTTVGSQSITWSGTNSANVGGHVFIFEPPPPPPPVFKMSSVT